MAPNSVVATLKGYVLLLNDSVFGESVTRSMALYHASLGESQDAWLDKGSVHV